MPIHDVTTRTLAPVFTPLRHRHKLKEHNWRQTILSYRADDAEKLVPAEMPPGSALPIRRDAGLGDCLMIACALAALKRKRPDLHITFATPPAYTAILARFDCIDEAIPLDEALVVGAPMLEFSNYCERHPQANITNRVTIFAQALGVAAGRLPTYTPTSADMQEAQLLLRGRRPIAICMRGKYPHRSWLIPRALQLAARLADEGLDVMLFDAEEQPPYTTWISDDLPAARAFGLPLPTVAALLLHCRAAVAPDTGFLHLCGCLGVPFVGIFAAIPPHLRTSIYRDHVDLIADGLPCVPCFEGQKHITCRLECLQAIDVDMVRRALARLGLTQYGNP